MNPSVSDPADLIGRAETRTLEFKAADALKRPFTIAREAVALLNAEGGEIWIGIPEGSGRARAPEQIADPDRARDSLRNHLIATIEPSPTDDELTCKVVKGLICVLIAEVAPRRPYCVRKDQGRLFLLRIDNRIREMTLAEVQEAFGQRLRQADDSTDAIAEAQRRLEDARSEEHRSRLQRFCGSSSQFRRTQSMRVSSEQEKLSRGF